MNEYLKMGMEIFIACILGGLIGVERESLKRPAGFRTHILVCVGATLAMQTNVYLMNLYLHIVPIDPSRIAAQVVSGIGFLGAGTIIKEGATVKGLTTAATLWTVACIGLAIGAGFYAGAIIATLAVFSTLTMFFKLEKRIVSSHGTMAISMITINEPGQIGRIGTLLGEYHALILDMEVETIDDYESKLHISIKAPRDVTASFLAASLMDLKGVRSISTPDS